MVKRALLIGCNYTATPQNRLYGCIDDIINIQNMLIDAYGYEKSNIVVLRDDNLPLAKLPTKSNIMSALAAIIAITNIDDEAWIHYSGHGTQVKVAGNTCESIVPSDFTKAGFILDTELFAAIAPSKGRLLMFFDSCTSGSVCNLQYSIQYQNGLYYQAKNSNQAIANPNVIMMSGCKDGQTSSDMYDAEDRDFEGAFTDALTNTLRANKHNVDIRNLYGQVCKFLAARRYSQIPVLSFSVANPVYQFARAPLGIVNTSMPNIIMQTSMTRTTKSLNLFPIITPSTGLKNRMGSFIK
jgi:hypothetical protein